MGRICTVPLLDGGSAFNDGLLRWCPLVENAGRVLRDISPRRKNGQLSGTVARNAALFGMAPYFSGGSYGQIAPTKIVSGFNAWTIALRFRNNITGGQALYCERGGGGTDIVKITAFTSRFDFVMRDDGGTLLNTIGTGSPISANTWTHVAVTKNGSSVVLYVNGKSWQTYTWSGTNNFTEANVVSTIGIDTVGGEAMTGNVQDLRLFSRALPASQILRLATIPWVGVDDGSGMLLNSAAADFSPIVMGLF